MEKWKTIPQFNTLKSYGNVVELLSFNRDEVNEFLDDIINKEITVEETKNKSLYVFTKSISQSKLREAGYTIVRDAMEADFIVISAIDNFPAMTKTHYGFKESCKPSMILDMEMLQSLKIHNKNVIYDSLLMQSVTNTEPTEEVFYTLDGLFSTDNRDNIKLAMEIMSRVDWHSRKVLLVRLMGLHYKKVLTSPYFKSIQFKLCKSNLTDMDLLLYFKNCWDNYEKYIFNDLDKQFIFKEFKKDLIKDIKRMSETYNLQITNIDTLEVSFLTNI